MAKRLKVAHQVKAQVLLKAPHKFRLLRREVAAKEVYPSLEHPRDVPVSKLRAGQS